MPAAEVDAGQDIPAASGGDADRTRATKQPHDSIFAGTDWTLRNPLNAPAKGQTAILRSRLRWSVWARGLSGMALVTFLRDEVFPFYGEVAERSAVNFMDGARLVIDEPTVLAQVVTLIDHLGLDDADADTKGDLFEHILKQIKQAGELGQFQRRATSSAPSSPCWTRGSATRCMSQRPVPPASWWRRSTTSGWPTPPRSQQVEIVDGKRRRSEDGASGHDEPHAARPGQRAHTQAQRADHHAGPRGKGGAGTAGEWLSRGAANPPFSGRVDKDRIVDDVKIGSTTATEILFLKYMMDSLDAHGRCGLVVPEGLLFGSTGAHKEIRRQLLERLRVDAVLSLPGGVFQPYSGVKTSVLMFGRGGATERVLFLHGDADGYKLDAQHDQPVEADDLPGLVGAFCERDLRWAEWQARDPSAEWTAKWWFADVATIRAQEFNLSAGRYRPMTQAAAEHRDPLELLEELRSIETEMLEEVDGLIEALQKTAAT